MKNFFSHLNLRKQIEFFNIAIGVVLIIISIVYLLDGDVDCFASWFIFGCMYMVMDKYWLSDSCTTLRVKADSIKYFINIAAFIVSIGFLIYIMV